jgi:MYXO-CTERM domain-containing protein
VRRRSRSRVKPGLVLGATCALAGLSLPAFAGTVSVAPGDDVEAAMNALAPGDELVLAGGVYTLTDAWHVTMKGTAAAPIVVRAKDGEHPHLDRPATDQNIIDFDDVEYVEFRGIEVSGGSAGLRLITANFVTIADCEIHGTADVAITANSGTEYQGLAILHNHIHDTGGTGEGMYIGCNSDACRVHDSRFEGNHIHDTKGPTVSQGDGIEIKEGSYANVVRDNVIHDTGYPCIITYSTVGHGGPNVIERNLLWNCGDHGIQSAADVIIRNNVILSAAGNGIANQPHQAGTPSNIQILHNTVLHPSGDGIVSSGITGSVLIANNAVYSQTGRAIRVAGSLGQVVVRGNVGMGTLEGVASGLAPGTLATSFVGAAFSGAPPNDVFPRPGSELIRAGVIGDVVTDDFNGTLRNGVADVGAYAYAATGNPGWPLGAGLKDAAPVPPGAGGSTGAGGATATGGTSTSGGANGAGGNAAAAGGSAGSNGSGGAVGGGGEGGGVTGGATGGGASDGGSTALPASKDGGGCGCRAAGAERGGLPWLVALALAVLVRKRRREGAR